MINNLHESVTWDSKQAPSGCIYGEDTNGNMWDICPGDYNDWEIYRMGTPMFMDQRFFDQQEAMEYIDQYLLLGEAPIPDKVTVTNTNEEIERMRELAGLQEKKPKRNLK